MTFLKILFIILALLVLFFPVLPFPIKLRRFSTFRALRYDPPHNRLNLSFVLLVIIEFVLVAMLYKLIFGLADGFAAIPFVEKLLSRVPSGVSFSATVVFSVFFLNLITLYALVILKAFSKRFLNTLFGFAPKKKKKKKKKGTETEDKTESKPDAKKGKKKLGRIAGIFRSKRKKEEDETPSDEGETPDAPMPERVTTAKNKEFQKEHPFLFRVYQKIWGIFFEKPDFVYARRYVFNAVAAVQFFIYLVEILYGILFFGMLLAVFFEMPEFLYKVFDWVTTKLYIYPFVSLLLLQELCNTFRSACKEPEEVKRKIEREEEEKEEEKKIALGKLRSVILRRYAKNHNIRFFPEIDVKELTEYTATNEVYKDALSYISTYMKANYKRVIQSYMSGLDAVFNGRHVYFGSSFYSQLGEYVIAYTYVRLLSGERMIFIVSDRSQVVKLQQYIGNRLTDITGVTRAETWRVYSADSHHVNEADVLIGVPEDFETDNLVENYPAFFEEACNAVFVDADRILNLNSYLCTIMASRLMTATDHKIRFMFLSRDVLQGFSASLRKFFCIDEEVVDCNSAEENEHVAYMLWNRERGALYNKHGQSETTIECLIADAAYDADVDGIRILTSVPLKPAEKQNFASHDVEINEFHKKVPRVNYMICTDDCSNLAAAIYAYTRFHGREASIVHILSRPYLLREYFGDRVEMYANRSDLIKPRATEHADTKKLLLLRILCEATASGNGMPISRFSDRVNTIMGERELPPAYDLSARVAYLLSELTYNSELIRTEEITKNDGTKLTFTMANKLVYNYYSIIQPERKSGYQLKTENHITFLRIEEVFEKLLTNNRRVELYLNGELLGHLDTFPERVHQQFLPGQSLIFDNCEYEIERIVDGGNAIYLRQENITYNSCMDTALLRRYQIENIRAIKNAVPGVYHFTTGILEKICVDHRVASIYGETYGFYNLMANSQTLDFVNGVVGNPTVKDEIVKAQSRSIKNGRVLSVRLYSRDMACNDGMRKLLAAVLSEFIRTMFPDAFRCIAVCPVLDEPTAPGVVGDDFNRQVETLYPYLYEGKAPMPKASSDCIELLIVNDAAEDIGVLDRLYDGAARIMEEIFSYIVDYLKWLKANPKLSRGQCHYIYFGSDKLPEIYDLDGCIALLANCVRDIDTCLEEPEETKKENRCAFCHCELEPGRFLAFDDGVRFICFECGASTVGDDDQLASIYEKVVAYWQANFPDVPVPEGVTVSLDDAYELDEEKAKNNRYYRVDTDERRIFVECDVPENNAFTYILRGLIHFWQKDNGLMLGAADAQLAYEEERYFRSIGADTAADYVLEIMDDATRALYDKIKRFAEGDADASDEDAADESAAPLEGEGSSFAFMLKEKEDMDDEDEEDNSVEPVVPDDDEGSDALFDPDRVPRFWKRYLRGKHASDDDGDPDSLAADADADETPDEGDADGASEVEADGADGDQPTDEKGKKDKKGKKGVSLERLRRSEELVPYEPEEKTNKLLHLYNEIVRRVVDYSREPISTAGISCEDLNRVYQLVVMDYPEFFWLHAEIRFLSSGNGIVVPFRCTLPNSEEVDVKRVEQMRKELRQSVKFFTKGITRKTKPYDAFLTIYRRVILNFDYDGVNMHSKENGNTKRDDMVRSLHSALVKKKVVCVGYAVAMQYLLQSVGICCGAIVSRTHEWNVVKFGRYCYHVDATWGDNSNTTREGQDLDKVLYNYCCVTTTLNNRGGDDRMVDPAIFRGMEELKATKHDYFRMTDAYLTSYDEDKIAAIFARAATEKPFEGAARCAAFRCCDEATYKLVTSRISQSFGTIIAKAKELVGKDKKAVKLLERAGTYYPNDAVFTRHYFLI